MKKILLVTFAAMMLASVSFAVGPFTPTPLELTVDSHIQYDFDGTDVDFTVGVSGKKATVYLWINTKLATDDLPLGETNGFRGWHYVNRIDTTVYVSGSYLFEVGTENKITWNGMGSENTSVDYGGSFEASTAVVAGEYDYCVWGFDSENPREVVCDFLAINYYWRPQYLKIGEFDDNGDPRVQPYLWGNINTGQNNYKGVGPAQFTAYKFKIGSDPEDYQNMDTCYMPGFSTSDGMELFADPIVFDPTDETVFYVAHEKITQGVANLHKWNWESGGDGTIDDSWAGDDLEIETKNMIDDGYEMGTGTDGENLFIVSPGAANDEPWDRFYVVNIESGELLNSRDIEEYYSSDVNEAKNSNGRLNRLYANSNMPGQAVVGGEKNCMLAMVNTDRLAADEDDYLKWTNGNGDFFNDANWKDDTAAETLWDCNSMEKVANSGRRDEQYFDSNNVTIQHPDFAYSYSWVTYTQDGTGVAYCKLVDDTMTLDTSSASKKGSGQRVDTGSLYDGMYLGQAITEDVDMYGNNQAVFWIAADSAMGIISIDEEEVPDAVEEAGQASFSVDAAYPNPANPTTTIGFTLAEAGHVTVDIFNVAGQKVDTLVDSEMSMGSHSVVWNASQFSAGVYFYTVASGSSYKTMKVTLLK
ncbi:T9SS type A sorting domain-containing protein [Candidatus Latescibacterota bacterium]